MNYTPNQNPNYPTQSWSPEQVQGPPPPKKTGKRFLVPIGVGVVALLAGVGIGGNSSPDTTSASSSPTVTVTAEAEPAPTVTVTETAAPAAPQACLDGFAAADRIRESAGTVILSMAEHFRADEELFSNFTEAQVDLYAEDLARHNAVMEEQTTILEAAVRDYETARAGCK